ncbi:MAG TPA: FecR domain-containing protein [Candidatus Angelobacter sp.]
MKHPETNPANPIYPEIHSPAVRPEDGLNQALAQMRAEQPTAETIEAAGDRVWQHLGKETAHAAVETIHGCQDVRLLLPEYRSGKLTAARALLVEAHLHECVDCRREAESGRRAVAVLEPWQHELPRGGTGGFRWALAAAAVVLAAISIYFVADKVSSGPAGMRASVVSFDGGLYRVGMSGEQLLKPGDEVNEGEKVRTAGGSRAMLRLRDGSMVEMNERAEFAVSMGRKDTTIQLNRGNIIVQAAKRETGHLYVAARDCHVSVTGTVFSVNSGMKGSRVSVIEGEVRVAENGVTSVLHSGDQISTGAAVGTVPVQREIAWSKDLDKHLALLAEFAKFQKKLETVQMPGLRYQSKVLPLLPASTVVYASIPNLGDAVHQANQLFQQQLKESPVLNEWWQQAQSRKGGPSFSEIIDEIHSLSQYVGDEIVFSVALDGREASPLVAAPVQRSGLKQFLETEYAKHHDSAKPENVKVFDEAGLMAAGPQRRGAGLYLLVRSDFVAAAVDLAALQRFNASVKQGNGGFGASAFGQRMNTAYQQGAGLLFGANLQVMTAERDSVHPHRRPEVYAQTGLADLEFLVVERKNVGNQPLNNAELTFSGPRRGFASWLAAPAPIGGLDFVSPNAGAAAAFIAKNPSQMLDDVLAVANASDAHAQEHLAKTESELNIRLRQDLADTLGGEVTLALDGPILPTPAWKVVVEVHNPGRLQSTIEQLVMDANTHIKDSGRRITIDEQSADGLTYYTIHFVDANKPAELDYTYADGYMVLGPSRALVKNAIAIHQSGNSLARSGDFRALLPQDHHADVSGLIYQNLAPLVGPIMNQLSASQLQSLQQIAAETKPSVVCAYGEPNAIRVASNSRLFGLDLNTATLSTLLKMTHPMGNH